jgi:putative transposase
MQPTMEKRKYSKEDKLLMTKEASEQGVTNSLEKHDIYPATFCIWKKKFETMGEEGFRHGMTPALVAGRQGFVGVEQFTLILWGISRTEV